MRRITLGLALCLVGGVAVAQVAPAPAAKPPAPPSPGATPQQAAPPPDAGPATAPSGPPEGMVVETPNGFYLVRPGQSAPRRLDAGPQPGAPDAMAHGGAASHPPQDDEFMEADDGPQPPPPPRHHPPRPPEGKGARFRIQSPTVTLGVKCPDDEPIKACVDAVSQLLDKTTGQAR